MKIPNKFFYITIGVVIAFAGIGFVILGILPTLAQEGDIYLPFIQQSGVQSSSKEGIPPAPPNEPPPSDYSPRITQEELDKLRESEEKAKEEAGIEDKEVHAKDIRSIPVNGKAIELPTDTYLDGMIMGVMCLPDPEVRCPRTPLYSLVKGESRVDVEADEGVIFFRNHEEEEDESERQRLIERDIEAFKFLTDILGDDKAYVPPSRKQ